PGDRSRARPVDGGEHEHEEREEPRDSLLREGTRVHAVRRDVRVSLELPRPDPERMALGPSDALGLGPEPAVVVALDPRALLEERQRARGPHDPPDRDAG